MHAAFVPLRNFSCYTMLDGAIEPKAIAERAAQLAFPAAALTDRNGLYAARVRRTGLNTEAKRLLLAHAFDTLGAACVQLRTDFLNLASRRAIERLGARLDGVLRGHMLLGEHRRDSAVYSIIEHEWPGVRRHLDTLLARVEDMG